MPTPEDHLSPIFLRPPAALNAAIREEARRRGVGISALCYSILGEALDVDTPDDHAAAARVLVQDEGLSQSEAARRLGVTASAVSRWLSGSRRPVPEQSA